jgi:DnaK suppressor protein
VDPPPVPERVVEPLEEHEADAVGADEAVRPAIEGEAAVRRQRARLREHDHRELLRIARAADERELELAATERAHAEVEGREARRTRGVDDHVPTAQAEHVRHEARQARSHAADAAVFGAASVAGVDALGGAALQLRQQLGPERGELGRRVEGGEHALGRGRERHVRGHHRSARVTDEHTDVRALELTGLEARVVEGGARDLEGPQVREVRRREDLRRQHHAARVEGVVLDEAAEVAVALAVRAELRIVVARAVEARRRHRRDRVDVAEDVAPERLGVSGARETAAHAHDGDREVFSHSAGLGPADHGAGVTGAPAARTDHVFAPGRQLRVRRFSSKYDDLPSAAWPACAPAPTTVRGAGFTPSARRAARASAECGRDVACSNRVGWLGGPNGATQPVSLPGLMSRETQPISWSRTTTMVRARPPQKEKEKPLTKAELKKFKARLEEEREAVALRIRERASTARIDGADLIEEMDQANRATEEAFNMRLLDKEVKLLREIDVAIAKFDADPPTYGICEGTDEPIERRRLEARPWTKYSVAYKEQLERAKKGHGSHG